MKVVFKNNAIEHKNNDSCIANEYDTEDNDINIACVKVNGRYPEIGRIANTICKELIFVSEGKGILNLEGKKIELKKGDVILIHPNEKYYWEGSFILIPACYPAWSFEQVKHFE